MKFVLCNSCWWEEILNKTTVVLDYNGRSANSDFLSLKLQRFTPEPSVFLPEPTKTNYGPVLFGGSNNCRWEEVLNETTVKPLIFAVPLISRISRVWKNREIKRPRTFMVTNIFQSTTMLPMTRVVFRLL